MNLIPLPVIPIPIQLPVGCIVNSIQIPIHELNAGQFWNSEFCTSLDHIYYIIIS